MKNTNRIRTAITVEDLYKAHSKLLNARAYKISSIKGVPYEELRSEANVAFVKTLWAYDPKRNIKFITLLYVIVNNQLLDYCNKWKKQLPDCKEFENGMESAIESGLEKLHFLRQISRQLSKEAQGVISIVLNCPDELVKFSYQCGVKTYRKGLELYLIKLGWSPNIIRTTFDEITILVKEN